MWIWTLQNKGPSSHSEYSPLTAELYFTPVPFLGGQWDEAWKETELDLHLMSYIPRQWKNRAKVDPPPKALSSAQLDRDQESLRYSIINLLDGDVHLIETSVVGSFHPAHCLRRPCNPQSFFSSRHRTQKTLAPSLIRLLYLTGNCTKPCPFPVQQSTREKAEVAPAS